MQLETLYKITKTGATQICDITHSGSSFSVTFGQLNGAMQTKKTECFTTNQGRSNERTPEQQAEFEALAKHKAKIKSGYTTSMDQPTGIQLPMKVKIYQDHINSIPANAVQSPKLNGVNAEFRYENEQLVLLSRGGNEYPMLEHLKPGIIQLLNQIGTTRIAGELYIHGEHLQDITSLVKKFKQHITPRLEFHVFDLPLLSGSYQSRLDTMNANDYMHPMIHHIASCNISDLSAEDFHTKCVKAGYEGTVIYDPAGLYQYNVRSSQVWKFKKMMDCEYKITDYSVDKNGNPVFLCLVDHTLPLSKDNSFSVSPRGTSQERKAMLANIDDYLGEWYTVDYETLSKLNKPLKPVGVGLRPCNTNGQPLN